MKYFNFFAISLLSVVTVIPADAKVSGVSVPGPYPHTPSQSAATTAAGINTRLTAKSYYEYQNGQLKPVDSFHYTYSNGRGGSPDEMDVNDDGVMFDESIRYIYDGNAFVNKLKRTQYYGVNDRIEWLYYNPWKASAQKWKDSVRYAYLYGGTGNQIMHARIDIASELDPTKPWTYGNNYLYNNSFTTSGFIDGIFSDDKQIYFAYDGNNNLVCRWIRIRNANSAQWYSTIKDSFTYDAAGRVNYVLHQVYDFATSDWMNDEQTFYTYINGMDNDIDYGLVEAWDAATNTWRKKEKHVFNFDASHNKTADITQGWNAAQGVYSNSNRIDWTYNYNHQVTSIATATWTGSSWAPIAGDYIRYFFYENYFKTGIDKTDAVVNMDLFPSPATDAVHFRIDWRTPQAFTMHVTDMQGRVLQQWNEKATGSYERTLDVAQWPAGNYLLTVNGTRGEATRRFVVAR